ncbi:DUF2634 domain-containing protein [Marinisporobacter balticus]|uniref:Uncharacterized protein DUF2634 n=1 Tax=Marinisporobacter balticus TaxID=2018667 RepID=A0A4R2LFI1_9FIRM|nr:DUF2634 domain-containing protein [Marinisporobacter balticus]TCO78015.1 uncharacterized protein DUF2634 [Marinisporobacter balticus]
MFPQVAQLQIKTNKDQDLPKMGKSFLFDFEKGEFVIKDGRLVETIGKDALKIWIEKVLRTEKYRYKVYERKDKNEYGVIIEDLIIGNNFPKTFVEAELRREITQALTKHPMIRSISQWEIKRKLPDITISFKVNLIDGERLTQEVMW